MDFTELLQRHDDPKHCEHPPGFDYKMAERRFAKFAEALSSALGVPLKSETGAKIQDASFHSQIYLPLGEERYALIRFSNFGDMATVGTVSEDESVPAALMKTVVELLEKHGYVYVPASVLDRPYTGRIPGELGIGTWWIRYFDWL
jgi:hypothetical protein